MREIKRIIPMSDLSFDSVERTIGDLILSGYEIIDSEYDSYGEPTYLELSNFSYDRTMERKYIVYPEKERIVYYEYRIIEDGSWVLLSSCLYDYRWRNIIRFAV